MSSIKGTSPVALVVAGAVCVAAGRLFPTIVEALGGTAPQVGWAAAVALAFAALAVGWCAWTTWQSLHKRHERMTSDHGVKMLAVGKAAAVVGAVTAGGYLGYALAFLDRWDTPLGKERTLHSAVAALAGLGLMVAGLFLEWACRIPGDDDEEGRGNGRSTSTNPNPA